ncbi:MAG: hypothetical protein J6X55_03505 [Victivallales bacterium]|nr:hypothetical protein [Victivallales bacterium]
MFFGLSALILTGLSWCTTGVITGDSHKKGLSISMVLFVGCIFFNLACIIALILNDELSNTPASSNWLVFGMCFISGILNNYALELTARMMSCGPKGISWAIFQSGMLFPFVTGIVFFGESLTFINGTGMVLMLTALLLFGLAKDKCQAKSNLRWILLGFAAFTINGILVTVTTLPSFFTELRPVSPILRALGLSIGLVVGAFLCEEMNAPGKFKEQLIAACRNRYLWIYVILQQSVRILVQFFLMFQGMNIMAEHGMGNAAYPIMVITNVGAVMLYNIIFGHERPTLMQFLALAMCLLGIVGLSVK